MTQENKQSLIVGALTSSFGIFISKALGLLYASPLSIMATESNMVFYGNAYSVYDIILNIFTAGIPFAVATMIAKYSSQYNYKTVLLINRISKFILIVSGLIAALLLLIFSTPLSVFILGKNAFESDITIQRNTFMILALALATVPLLSGSRSFLQGFKEMKIYSFTQVLEQFIRVFFLLIASFVLIYIFKFDREYAIYMGILAASVAALATYLYLYKKTKIRLLELKRLASIQIDEPITKEKLFKELMYFGLPYLFIILLGNSTNIVNSLFFLPTMVFSDIPYEEAKLMLGIIQFNVVKINSIPQTLALGFSAGMVPYMTISLEKRKFKTLRKNIIEILETVLYIVIPLSCCLIVLAKPIYSLMYGNDNIDLGTSILAYSSVFSLLGTISPICSSIILNLRMRKKVIMYLAITFMTKLITFFPLVYLLDYKGVILSSIISTVVSITLCLVTIKKQYKVNFTPLLLRIVIMIIGVISMNGMFSLLDIFITINIENKLILFSQLALYGVLGFIAYYMTTYLFRIPQKIYKKAMRSR